MNVINLAPRLIRLMITVVSMYGITLFACCGRGRGGMRESSNSNNSPVTNTSKGELITVCVPTNVSNTTVTGVSTSTVYSIRSGQPLYVYAPDVDVLVEESVVYICEEVEEVSA